MQLLDGQPVYSATDLVAYLACEHRPARAGGTGRARGTPMRDDPELDVIRKRGFEHERGSSRTCGRPAGHRSRSIARFRGDQGRAAAGEHDRRGDARRCRRHLPGDLLRRHVARSRRLPAAGRAPASRRARSARTTTRSPTRSWPATSRRAPSSRSARTSTSSSGSRGAGRSGCTSRSGEAPGRSGGSASTTTWPTTARAPIPGRGGRTDGRPSTRRPHLSGAGRALRRLSLGRRVRDPPASRRPPQPGGRDLVTPASGLDGESATTGGPRGAVAADDAPRGHERAALLRVREQARIQLREAGGAGELLRPRHELGCCPEGDGTIEPGRGWAPRPARRRRAISSSTSRAIRTHSTTGSTTCSASSRRGRRHARASGRVWSAARRTTASFTSPPRGAFERLIGLRHGAPRAGSHAPRLPLRAVRADRPEAL